MTALPATELWEEICVITDHCLHLTKCAVQSVGRAMSTMITQERVRWLNHTGLSDKQKCDILDESVDWGGLFGPAVATMQKQCEEKKKEEEALHLCPFRKTQDTPAPRRTFPAAVEQQASDTALKIPRRPAPQPQAQGQPPPNKGPWQKKSFAAVVTQRGPPASTSSQGARRKKRA